MKDCEKMQDVRDNAVWKWLNQIAGYVSYVDGHFRRLPCEIGQTSSSTPMRLHCVINYTRNADLCYLGIGNGTEELVSQHLREGTCLFC
jgi:hypothetical protein